MGDGEAVHILLTTPQLSMESSEEQSVGRGYRRGGATMVETVEQQYDVYEYPQPNYQPNYNEEMNYFDHGNAKTLRTLSESYANNDGVSSHNFRRRWYYYVGALLLLYVLW